MCCTFFSIFEFPKNPIRYKSTNTDHLLIQYRPKLYHLDPYWHISGHLLIQNLTPISIFKILYIDPHWTLTDIHQPTLTTYWYNLTHILPFLPIFTYIRTLTDTNCLTLSTIITVVPHKNQHTVLPKSLIYLLYHAKD